MSRDFARDQALQTLLLALEQEPDLLPAEGPIAFLNARPAPELAPLKDRLHCQQDYKPQTDALVSGGFTVNETLTGPYSLILHMPNRQREATLGEFAQAFSLLEDNGALLVSIHNDWGAKRYEKNLAEFAGEVGTLSKYHCRAFWARKTAALDTALQEEWLQHLALRKVIDDRFWSRPGLFSWDEIDEGSRILMEHLPSQLSGRVADLGCSWGALSDFVMRKYEDITSLDAFEADRVAVECARRNLGLIPTRYRPKVHWTDLTHPEGAGDKRYDVVVMNPPFHEGRNADPLLGAKFIAAAHKALKPGGTLYMVANRHLPYEHLLEEIFTDVQRLVQSSNFKVFVATRPGAA